MTMTRVNPKELPVTIEFAQEVARKVTDVAEYAVRVQPAGAAVTLEKVLPVLIRNRISYILSPALPPVAVLVIV